MMILIGIYIGCESFTMAAVAVTFFLIQHLWLVKNDNEKDGS